MSLTRVLMVEDDPNIVDLVRSNLLMRGFDVLVNSTGEDVVSQVQEYEPEIVLLDLMLPSIDGFELCRTVRAMGDIGLIVVSARAGEVDKVRALNLGADDYLTKPFGIDELLARMTATLRRSRPTETPVPEIVVTMGHLRIDFDAKAVFSDGQFVQLTPTEFSLLQVFATNPGKLLTYDRLLRDVWGRGYENSREYVRVYVGRLRNKLEVAGGGPVIVTEPRSGYRMVDLDHKVEHGE